MSTPVAETPPTPENVAEFLTRGDNDYHDGNLWKPSIGSAGSVVHIKIVPDAEDGTELDPVHFEAHVFAVEPAPACADASVHLDPAVARELTYIGVGYDYEGWTVVDDIEGEHRRWAAGHTLVIRNEQGQHFAVQPVLDFHLTAHWINNFHKMSASGINASSTRITIRSNHLSFFIRTPQSTVGR